MRETNALFGVVPLVGDSVRVELVLVRCEDERRVVEHHLGLSSCSKMSSRTSRVDFGRGR